MRGLPFQFTTEPETNPAPFTVRVNPGLPGAMASGISGWSIKGTGFCATAGAASSVMAVRIATDNANATTRLRMLSLRRVVMDDLI